MTVATTAQATATQEKKTNMWPPLPPNHIVPQSITRQRWGVGARLKQPVRRSPCEVVHSQKPPRPSSPTAGWRVRLPLGFGESATHKEPCDPVTRDRIRQMTAIGDVQSSERATRPGRCERRRPSPSLASSARTVRDGHVAQLVRAPASHAGGPQFESGRAHHSARGLAATKPVTSSMDADCPLHGALSCPQPCSA